jgi:hypothetical protein
MEFTELEMAVIESVGEPIQQTVLSLKTKYELDLKNGKTFLEEHKLFIIKLCESILEKLNG